MLRVGFVGWRGMVGSVLIERMLAEGDFRGFEPLFFSTSDAGGKPPAVGLDAPPLADAGDLRALAALDVVVTCQGGDYTSAVYPELRKAGWKGYWIDAASTLRMKDDAIIVLDPVNRDVIDRGLAAGVLDYIGGNCTVSLMLMALAGLFRQGLVEWLSTMTYQSASGAGAKNMTELVRQMAAVTGAVGARLADPAATALELDALVSRELRSAGHPTEQFGAPLAGSVIPWIDRLLENGQTREEWKGYAETNKILGTPVPVPVDGLCVRVGAMRCHSQALTVKLTRDVPLDEVTAILASANEWVRVVPNDKASTLAQLTPAAVSGTLTVPIGRVRKMILGPGYLTAFTLGDQLLWGAAEPLRRMLRIVLEHRG
ncbi:MAG: aspartate-semialdehyde dehydrogenase [Deferrisomatales bacterium]